MLGPIFSNFVTVKAILMMFWVLCLKASDNFLSARDQSYGSLEKVPDVGFVLMSLLVRSKGAMCLSCAESHPYL